MDKNQTYLASTKHTTTWPFSVHECLTHLAKACTSRPSLRYSFEWSTIACETLLALHPLLDEEEKQAICKAIIMAYAPFASPILKDGVSQYAGNITTLASSVAAGLCVRQDKNTSEITNRLYAFLPEHPSPATFHAYMTYQMSYGFTNKLKEWKDHYWTYASRHGWSVQEEELLKIAQSYVMRDHEALANSQQRITALCCSNAPAPPSMWMQIFLDSHPLKR